jgi:hypothetical protein
MKITRKFPQSRKKIHLTPFLLDKKIHLTPFFYAPLGNGSQKHGEPRSMFPQADLA